MTTTILIMVPAAMAIILNARKFNLTIPMTTFLLFVSYTTLSAQNTSEDKALPEVEHNSITRALEPQPAPAPEPIYRATEVMPRFPGCEDMEGSDREKEQCANGKLMHFIYENITYPAQDKDKGVDGTVIVSFVVNKTGRLEDIKLVRGMDTNMGTAALKVVHLMNELPEGWTPAKQEGEIVKVQYYLPIRFKLEG